MHKWQYAITLVLSILITPLSIAENWMCGQDLNGNGNVADPGETQACVTIDGDKFCPLATDCDINSKKECTTIATSLGSYTTNLFAGIQTQAGQTSTRHHINFFQNKHTTTLYNPSNSTVNSVNITDNTIITPSLCQRYPDLSMDVSVLMTYPNPTNPPAIAPNYIVNQYPTCANGMVYDVSLSPQGLPYTPLEICYGSFCSNWNILSAQVTFTASITKETCEEETTYACPLGNEYACLNNNGKYQCSQNRCVDLDVATPEITDNITGTMLVDDGQRDNEGLCMDQLMIYSGKASECLTSGTQTAFQNCCDSGDGQILTDDVGSIAGLAGSFDTVKTVYTIAEGAFYTYQNMLATGSTVAEASAAAATTATQGTLIAIDPTTLAISVALHFVMDYLTKACDSESMNTAIMSGSGYCHYIGEYCKEEWDFVGCVQEAKSYCCFNSKMARIIHQQGRPQLNSFGANSWGSVEAPNCRGFTPEEFQSLDFSKIDLTEYYQDLTRQTEGVIQQKVNEGVNDFYNQTR
ncbi:conjugal transfer protein TraN [Endozoicomonas sp. ONNA1]|uniref:conjugal transfer protein TraN n=1 Tax=Endozoicomonas sp. ONNA1 TaxID=2828740 RepID=UPI0021480A41|nr:conjugal transfer protein TraN [Endozoicomonas sp. ONNA1]